MKWEPLIITAKEKSAFLSVIESCSQQIITIPSNEQPGLFGGAAGKSIFWHYFFISNLNQCNSGNCFANIQYSLNAISNRPLTNSLGVGISGIIWSLCHLQEIGAVNARIENIIGDEINSLLQDYSKTEIKKGNYDFIHGGLGPTLFLLCRPNDEPLIKELEEIVRLLEEKSHAFHEGITWQDFFGGKTITYNLGLAHGIPSIIVLLSRLLQNNILPDVTSSLLENSINWLLAKKQDNNSNCLFPNFVPDDSSGVSRLGWCYGDLGIGIAILQAGQITKNLQWTKIATEIGIHASKRRDLKGVSVYDAGLCHGTTGIAHIFNRFYQYTGVEEFKEASVFWYLQTLRYFESTVGLKARRYFVNSDKEEYLEEFGLLEGYAGIGLALISSISNVEPKWDRCLLLS